MRRIAAILIIHLNVQGWNAIVSPKLGASLSLSFDWAFPLRKKKISETYSRRQQTGVHTLAANNRGISDCGEFAHLKK